MRLLYIIYSSSSVDYCIFITALLVLLVVFYHFLYISISKINIMYYLWHCIDANNLFMKGMCLRSRPSWFFFLSRFTKRLHEKLTKITASIKNQREYKKCLKFSETIRIYIKSIKNSNFNIFYLKVFSIHLILSYTEKLFSYVVKSIPYIF